MTLRFTLHALDMLVERELQPDWIERTVAAPDWAEPDPAPGLMRSFRVLPERQGRILRVVTREDDGVQIVISCFLDRKAQPPR